MDSEDMDSKDGLQDLQLHIHDSKDHLRGFVNTKHDLRYLVNLEDSKDSEPDVIEDSKDDLQYLVDQHVSKGHLRVVKAPGNSKDNPQDLVEDSDDSKDESQDSVEDPLAPSLRNQQLEVQSKVMLLNVHKYMVQFRLTQAKERGVDMNVLNTVAEATGVSKATVKKVLAQSRSEEGIKPPTKKRNRKRKNDAVRPVNITNLKQKK